MTFRTALLVAMMALISAIVGAVVLSVGEVLERSTRSGLDGDLERSRRVLEQLASYRETLHASQARVVAEEPRLKAVVATEDITHETVLGVARDLARSADTDIFLIGDARGRLMADVTHPEDHGQDISGLPLVARALRDGEASDTWVDDENAYQVHGRRLAFGNTVVGVLVIGYAIEDEFAEKVSQQTGSQTAVTLDDRIIARSFELEDLGAGQAGIINSLHSLDGTRPAEIGLGGTTYVALAGPLPGYEGEARLRYGVFRSLDEALAPSIALKQILYGIAAAALIAASILALLLSSRLSRPLGGLVAFTRRVGAGDLHSRAEVAGLRETQALGSAMNLMVEELERSREQVAAKERLEKEMEIANQLQTSMLPRRLESPGLDIAAQMIPATEVGGDYYDVIPLPEGGCWLGIGDVAGHGMPAGVVMLMMQTAVASLVKENPNIAPRDLVAKLNEVMYENIRQRLDSDEHVTFCMLRHDGQGKFTFAGAHEEIVLWRAGEGTAEIVPTPGAWLGFSDDIREATVDNSMNLEQGDVMILFTDGVTEAMREDGEQFGLDRLRSKLGEVHEASPDDILQSIIASVTEWVADQDDDITMMVVRYTGTA